ncbi:hypothetical protein LTS10_010521 [Elasticomyces elasticus]|nr:hypothetical protein LTS10_010521 [Elasticomyces elasticus]
MLAQEIEAIVKPIKLSIDQACNKIVTKPEAKTRTRHCSKDSIRSSRHATRSWRRSEIRTYNKIVAKIDSQGADQTLQQGFDVREQILDNARILWPILEARRCRDGSSANNSVQRVTPPMTVVIAGGGNAVCTVVLPDMEVVVVGTGTTIFASVVRSNIPGYEVGKYIFMRTDDTDSVEKSITKLLELTMDLLNKEFGGNFYREKHDTQIDVVGKGYYF